MTSREIQSKVELWLKNDYRILDADYGAFTVGDVVDIVEQAVEYFEAKQRTSKMSQEIEKIVPEDHDWNECFSPVYDGEGTTGGVRKVGYSSDCSCGFAEKKQKVVKQLSALFSTAVDDIIGEDDTEEDKGGGLGESRFIAGIRNDHKKEQRQRNTRWFE